MSNQDNKGSTASKGGIGFCGLLALIFIVLKLTKVIAWSWLWVLAPLWIPAAFAVLCLLALVFVMIGGKK